MRLILAGVLVHAIAAPLSGCSILLEGDDCDFGDGGDSDEALEEVVEYRNPDTGQCFERIVGPGPGGSCELVPADTGQLPQPEFGRCFEECAGAANEADCHELTGCRAAYIERTGAGEEYNACWSVSPGGTERPVQCEGLSAYECSLWDSCSPVHSHPCVGGPQNCGEPDVGVFERCRDEVVSLPTNL